MPLSLPQVRVLSVAADGAVFRDAPGGGNWLYQYPGKPLMRPAAGVTCRSLVKHGWLERIRVDDEPHATLYVISAKGRQELAASGIGLVPQAGEAAPENIKF